MVKLKQDVPIVEQAEDLAFDLLSILRRMDDDVYPSDDLFEMVHTAWYLVGEQRDQINRKAGSTVETSREYFPDLIKESH